LLWVLLSASPDAGAASLPSTSAQASTSTSTSTSVPAKVISVSQPVPSIGPAVHALAHEKDDKKAIDAFFKALDAAIKIGDVQTFAALVDFPVTVLSDDGKGSVVTVQLERDAFLQRMSPFLSLPPEAKLVHQRSTHLLSDVLAVVDEADTLSQGKHTVRWNAASWLVQREGQWRLKEIAEAGWAAALQEPAAAAATTTTNANPQAPSAPSSPTGTPR
jgi:hypothetical protein